MTAPDVRRDLRLRKASAASRLGRGVVLGLALVLSALSLGGCARVKPYQREYLSERAMQPGAESAEDAFRAHWQSSREGSEGGFVTAGGGCGCN